MAIDLLIVDDSALFRNVLKRELEPMGFRVVGEAGNAIEGLRLFRSAHPHLVTLDIMMPLIERIDAKYLFRTIRQESPNTAVVLMSTRLKEEERTGYLREGALDYVQKPFIDFPALGAVLKRAFPEIRE
ncbi:MAG: response regulator [Candidatus Binataceae bacterium]